MKKSLNGTWLLSSSYLEEKNKNNLKVTVPGSVYNDLLHHKLIPDPFFRDNEARMLDIMEYDFSYSRTFKVSKKELEKEAELVFLGLDTVSEIYLNDNLVDKTFNMHRRYTFKINEFLREGENTLRVVIKSPLKFIRSEFKKNTHKLMNMDYAVKGYATIRKSHCMFGWDWGPQMPDGGIWRDVYLNIYDKGKINEVLVYQDTNLDKSYLTIKVSNHLLKDNLDIVLTINHNGFDYSTSQKAKVENVFEVEINNPDLWYPYGYGSQPLYDFSVDLMYRGNTIDQNHQRIGLRKME